MGVSKNFPQDQLHIENCTKFCTKVEALVAESNVKADETELATGRKRPRLTYIQAVLIVAEEQNIEEAMAAAYLSPDIKDKIRVEAENLNMIEKSASLPF